MERKLSEGTVNYINAGLKFLKRKCAAVIIHFFLFSNFNFNLSYSVLTSPKLKAEKIQTK